MAGRTADLVAKTMTEEELTSAVIECAQTYGWLVYHARPARTDKGWRTLTQGDAGFPDIVAAKDGSLVIAELKSERGRFGPGQAEWLDAVSGEHRFATRLRCCAWHNYRDGRWMYVAVWYPADWLSGAIERVFKGEL